MGRLTVVLVDPDAAEGTSSGFTLDSCVEGPADESAAGLADGPAGCLVDESAGGLADRPALILKSGILCLCLLEENFYCHGFTEQHGHHHASPGTPVLGIAAVKVQQNI